MVEVWVEYEADASFANDVLAELKFDPKQVVFDLVQRLFVITHGLLPQLFGSFWGSRSVNTLIPEIFYLPAQARVIDPIIEKKKRPD